MRCNDSRFIHFLPLFCLVSAAEYGIINMGLIFYSYDSIAGTVTSWKAFGIGPGKKRAYGSEIVLPCLELTEEFSLPKLSEGDFTGKRARTSLQPAATAESHELPGQQLKCPEPGCSHVSATHQVLEKHVLTGQHRISSHDLVTLKWKERLESITTEIRTTRKASTSTSALLTATSAQGWALRTTRRAKHHSGAIKQYLTALFERGQQTGKKADPAAVAQDLKTARSADGKKAFHPDDWLSPQQIASFFSRLAALAKSSATTEEADVDAEVDLANRDKLKDSFFNAN